MTFGRDTIEAARPRLRNTPLRPREWDEILERDDVTSVRLDEGEMALVPRDGQLFLHFAFLGEEEGRVHFAELFDALEEDIEDEGWPYSRVDLVEMMNRIWIEPLLSEADFRQHGEWMEMERRELNAEMPAPEIPETYRMRRATEADHDSIIAIEAAAYADASAGEEAMRIRLQQAAWAGVLEHDGAVVGYAVNGGVERNVARVLSLAVEPDSWGAGLGRVLVEAAAYQIASQGAARAVVELNPTVGASIRAARDAGFRPGRRGIEWRRTTDPEMRAAIREEARRIGVKARFGEHR
ncbi:MAG: N-acetyltransferase [Dehalococcoidia bacterium]|nr:N-acetyltransferase [Dehalococcoidia bacterium]